MGGVVECDEVYVTAGLKGRNNGGRIEGLGRRPRRRGLKRRGLKEHLHPGWEGSEDYVPSNGVEAETALKIIGRRVSEGSTVYTDCFKAYASLSGAGYRHEAVNHSAGEWVGGEARINNCENRASGHGYKSTGGYARTT